MVARNPAGRCRLTLRIGGQDYRVRPLRGDLAQGVVIAWGLTRVGTAAAPYVVAETLDGPTCSCQDMKFRRHGKDPRGCKHARALRALGLLF